MIQLSKHTVSSPSFCQVTMFFFCDCGTNIHFSSRRVSDEFTVRPNESQKTVSVPRNFGRTLHEREATHTIALESCKTSPENGARATISKSPSENFPEAADVKSSIKGLNAVAQRLLNAIKRDTCGARPLQSSTTTQTTLTS